MPAAAPPPVPPPGPRARPRAAWGLLLLALLALLIAAAWGCRPQALPEPPPPAAGAARLPCLSYAPYRLDGRSPLQPGMRVPPEDIEADLRRLQPLTRCVRSYAVDQGLEALPAIAERLGMSVKLGVWIGRDPQANAAQLQTALALTHAHPRTIRLLIVGNEVLLRGEQTPADLARLLAQARAGSAVPVTYADVWEFWWRHAELLRPHVDTVTVHILPYWEDEPVGVDEAVAHVLDIAARTQAHFPGQPLLIGETGWPAAGRQRQAAAPGPVAQARFTRELLARSAGSGLDFNVIEAYDQPWKRQLEGAMGGAWGLLDAAGRPHFPWTGPMPADPRAPRLLAAAAAGAAALGLLGALAAAPGRRRATAAASAVTGGLLGGLVPLLPAETLLWGRGAGDPVLGAAVAALAVAWAGLAALRLLQPLARPASLPCSGHAVGGGRAALGEEPGAASPHRADPPDAVPALPGLRAAWALRAGPGGRLRLLAALLRALLLFGLATLLLWQLADGRYRGFPLATVLIPALLGAALALAGERLPAGAREERAAAVLLALGAPALLLLEGLANDQAQAYAAALLLLAGPLLLPPSPAVPASAAPDPGASAAAAASSRPGAAGPAA